MMYSNSYAGSFFWLHFHWIFVGLALFGFIAALLWLYKHANKKDFLNIVWATLIVGILGTLLSASIALSGWSNMMSSFHGNNSNWSGDDQEEMWQEMEDYLNDRNITQDAKVDDDSMDDIMDEMMDFDEE